MARNTKRKIKTTQVSTNEIREVFNSDINSRPIPERVRKASDFFVDGSVENSIYDNFIESKYCSADDGETKKDKLTRQPYSWGHWRNYGGNEFGEEFLPEIYWSNVMTDTENEHIPQTTEVLLEMSGINEDSQAYIPRITINTPIENSFAAISSSIASAQGLPNEDMSYLHRPDDGDITEAKLGTKIGIDYINNSYPGVPEFDVKVTPFLATESLNYWIENKQFLAFDTLRGISTGDITTLTSLSEFASETLTTYSSELESYINFLSSKGYSGDDLEAMLGLIGNAKIKKIDFLTESVKDTASNLDGFSTALLLLNVANLIWDVAHPPARITQMSYQYQQVIDGMYSFLDIKDCTYKINPDNFQLYGNVKELLLPEEGSTTSYSLNNPNFGEPLSPTNIITRFPNRNVTRDKFLNFWFFTRAVQYDVCTPPPVVEYLVELIPTAFCKLSETKVTKFIVRVLPDKYLQPLFNIETEVNESPFRSGLGVLDPFNPISTLYNNTSILFKNGKYADLILLKALDESGGILGYFDTFVNAVVGSCYNAAKNGSYYGDVVGKDVLLSVPSIVAPYTPIPYPKGFLGGTSIYEVYFQAESVRNVILNPYFRVEKSNSFGDELTKYWTYDSGLEIQRGAIVKSATGVSTLEQNLPSGLYVGSTDYPSYYLLNIEFNNSSGYLYLDTSDTLFDTNIYDKHNKLTTPALGLGKPYRKTVIPDSEWGTPENFEVKVTLEDYNVSIESDSIKFLGGGMYSILLKALPSATKKIKFTFSSDFIGSLSKCTLTRMPNSSAGVESRGNYSLQTFVPIFQYIDDVIKSKTFYLFFTGPGSFDMEVQAFNTALISVYTYNNVKYGNSVQLAPGTHTVPVPAIGQNVRVEVEITNFKETSDLSYEYPCNILSLICNSSSLYGIVDDLGVLTDAYINFASTSLKEESVFHPLYKRFFNQSLVEYYTNNPKIVASFDVTTLNGFFAAKQILYNKDSNVFANLPISINTLLMEDSTLEGYLYILRGVISDKLDLSNTNIEGTLIDLLYIPEVVLVNTKISKLGTGPTTYKLDVEPKLTWKNSNIGVEELNNLLIRLDNSATLNGTLDIAGDNPEITDEHALKAIDNLIDRGWNVLYNAITIPVITLIGDNPQTIEVGNSYVELGATAEDAKDGDITADIVIDATDVDVNTLGSYEVTYNVTDSDGYTAEEVIRAVDVEDTTIPVITVLGTDPVTITQGDVYVDAGATALDNYDGDITDNIITYNPVNVNVIDSYNITYNVQDSSGNNAIEKGRVVNVISAVPVFPEVTIGTQTWMAVNLDIDDGQGGIYAYNNDEINVATYGRLYTWYAAVRVAASIDGWHLPSDAEWTTLTDYLGGLSVAGGKLKETGTTHWASPNTGATDEYGFTALPGGNRNNNGTFYHIGKIGIWGSATETNATFAWCCYMYSNYSNVVSNSYNKESGFSVRLIKD